jgi:hypothetical protein
MKPTSTLANRFTARHPRALLMHMVLLWLIWASRAHAVMKLPIFVDESLHILRAQMVFQFTDATASFLPGKLLLYYYLGLFAPQDVGGAWLARQAVVLLSPLGAALSVALARRLFGGQGIGFWVLILYLFTPFLIFFERMALADSFVMMWGLALSLAVVRFVQDPTPRRGLWAGAMLGASWLAKLTALPWVIVPLLGWWLLGHRRPIPRLAWVSLYATVGGLLALPALYVVYQALAPVGEKQEVITTTLYVTEEESQIAQILHNLTAYSTASAAMFTLPLLLIITVSVVWQSRRRPRPSLYLLGVTTAAVGFVVVTAARPSTRYLVVGVPPLLILTAASLAEWAIPVNGWRGLLKNIRGVLPKPLGRGDEFEHVMGWPLLRHKLLPLLVVLIVLVALSGQGLGFLITAWDEPANLHLAERDVWEYMQNATTGYALASAAHDLPHLPPRADGKIPVAGFVAACHTLRLYLPADHQVELDCPYFKWRPEFTQSTLEEWTDKIRSAGSWYILADEEQSIDLWAELPVIWEEIAVYPRPHNGVKTILYRVTAKSDS